MAQQQAIHKFALGQKEVEGKQAEFWYDRGWYSIVEVEGEERNAIYRSRNAQEAYMKWNVYIGRKKERPVQEDRRRGNEGSEGGSRRDSRSRSENRDRSDRGERGRRGEQNERSDRRQEPTEGRDNRSRRRQRDNRRDNHRQQRERDE
jgi:hypothetical protein